MKPEIHTYYAPQAWVDGAWVRDAVLGVGADGRWSRILGASTPAQRLGATPLSGAVLPGLVNAHSHAFQRAIAGLTERRSSSGTDTFWSWRQRMYAAALQLDPEALEAIATQLYGELLAGGFTQVCEFHYLHHDRDGQAYANPAEMSLALVRAAQRVGLSLTLLPTLYMHAGFGATALAPEQRRFAGTPALLVRIAEEVRQAALGDARIQVGVALHSLRAVAPPALRELAQWAAGERMPLHIHIAEQQQEVDDCLAHTGQRPLQWLLEHAPVNAHWSLVHATQATPQELADVAASGAGIVLCPATEANLGDGLFDLPGYAQAAGRWSLGTDSHVTRSWPEELRLLEYGQRLQLRQRNVAARLGAQTQSAAALLQGALAGGSAAAGLPLAGLAVGQRADAVVLPQHAAALLGVPDSHLLDALVFSSPGADFSEVLVAGQRVPQVDTAPAFVRAMRQLWAGVQ